MSSDPFYKDKFRRPEIFLSEVLRKGAQGKFSERDEGQQFLYRALVVAVDVEGGKLENEAGTGKVEHQLNGKKFDVPATVGPDNPRNSIKARILSEGLDQFMGDDNLRVFWPFFPEHQSVPIKPGEHVYVVFEDGGFQHGLWVTKVPGHEGVNYVRGQSTYKASQTLAAKFGDSGNDNKLNKDEDAAESKPDKKLTNLFKD